VSEGATDGVKALVDELIGDDLILPEEEEKEVEVEAEVEVEVEGEPDEYESLRGLTMEDVLKGAARNKEDWDKERERLRHESAGRLQHSRDLREENKRLREDRPAQPQPQVGGDAGPDVRFKEGSDQPYIPQESIDASVSRAVEQRLAPTPEQIAWSGWNNARSNFNREHQEAGVLANARADKVMGRMTELIGDENFSVDDPSDSGAVIAALDERGHLDRMTEEHPDLGRRGLEDMVEAIVEMRPFKVTRMLSHFLDAKKEPVDTNADPVLRKPRDDARSPAARGHSDEGPGTNIEQRAAELAAKNPMDLSNEELKELQDLNRRIERAS